VAGEFVAAEAAAGADDPARGGAGSPAGLDDNGAAGQVRQAAGGGPLAWYGDSAYGSGELRDTISQAGHQAVIKPMPVQRPVQGGFTIDDFTVAPDQNAVTCPAGVTRPVARSGRVTFGAACRGCPLRERCTTSADGRSLKLTEHDAALRAARAAWTSDPTLRQDYARHRPNIERAIAQVATWRGRRLKLRYRGVARNHAWLKRRTAALNLRNLTGKGLTRRNGAWILAT
jgi:hypothetical protein